MIPLANAAVQYRWTDNEASQYGERTNRSRIEAGAWAHRISSFCVFLISTLEQKNRLSKVPLQATCRAFSAIARVSSLKKMLSKQFDGPCCGYESRVT